MEKLLLLISNDYGRFHGRGDGFAQGMVRTLTTGNIERERRKASSNTWQVPAMGSAWCQGLHIHFTHISSLVVIGALWIRNTAFLVRRLSLREGSILRAVLTRV